MPASADTDEKPWPHPWPKGGRPRTIANAVRWNLYVDGEVRTAAEEVARAAGSDLPSVMRQLMAAYAAGIVTPQADSSAEPTP